MLARFHPALEFLLSANLQGPEMLRLYYAADLVVCCLNALLQGELKAYAAAAASGALARVSYDTLQRRKEFAAQLVQDAVMEAES